MKKKSVTIISDERYHNVCQCFPLRKEQVDLYSCQEVDRVHPIESQLLISDCGLYVEKGLKLLREIKARYSDMPIVFLTDTSSEDIAIEAFRAGAREFFKKPVSTGDLQRVIVKLLMVKRTSREKRYPYMADKEPYDENGFSPSKTGKPYHIARTVKYIEDNLSEDLSLVNLAKIANISKYHYCREFKKYTSSRDFFRKFGSGQVRLPDGLTERSLRV